MRKLLTLLTFFISTIVFGQDIKLEQNLLETNPFAVGDTITVQYKLTNSVTSLPTLINYDFQYNNKLLQYQGYSFKVNSNGTNTSAATSLSIFDGYKWSSSSTHSDDYLTGQYNEWNVTAQYNSNTDWSVGRVTIQDGIAIAQDTSLLEVTYTVKDKNASTYTTYTDMTNFTFANLVDNSTNTVIDTWATNYSLSLDSVSGTAAGSITINLGTDSVHPTDYKYEIYDGTTLVTSGNFDASYQASVSGLINNTTYSIVVYVDDLTATWLDDVVTISDVYLVFQESIGVDTTNPNVNNNVTFSSYQSMLGDVNGDSSINFSDSYEMLAHVDGMQPTSIFTTSINGSIDISGMDGLFPSILSANFILTETSNTIFTVNHALLGDVNSSHSWVDTSKTTGKSTPTIYKVETSDLDISSSLVNGKVEVSISTTKEGLVGSQFNITYDTTILTLENVKFDTGNDMTNFANHKNNKISIGSLDYTANSTIKTGTPYKLIFLPKETITNTSGLIYFEIVEGVKADGTQVKFNIQ